jgi:hypothetical protein
LVPPILDDNINDPFIDYARLLKGKKTVKTKMATPSWTLPKKTPVSLSYLSIITYH